MQKEEAAIRRETNTERVQSTRLNLLRRRRLMQEYKQVLVANLNDKKQRQASQTNKCHERASNSYKVGIEQRDHFFTTTYTTNQSALPVSFDQHKKDFLASKLSKPPKKEEDNQ